MEKWLSRQSAPLQRNLTGRKFHRGNGLLNILKDELAAPAVDREILADIVSITHQTRAWVSPEGMLGSNHLLTKEQAEQLLLWADIIEECLMWLLDEDEEEAFAAYHEYMEGELT